MLIPVHAEDAANSASAAHTSATNAAGSVTSANTKAGNSNTSTINADNSSTSTSTTAGNAKAYANNVSQVCVATGLFLTVSAEIRCVRKCCEVIAVITH